MTEYQVYRDGTLIGTVLPGASLEFLDHGRDDVTDEYSIITVNQFGQESAPVTITLR